MRFAGRAAGSEDRKRERARPKRVEVRLVPEPVEDERSRLIFGTEDERAAKTRCPLERRENSGHARRRLRKMFDVVPIGREAVSIRASPATSIAR